MSNREKFKETFGQIQVSKDVLDEMEHLEIKPQKKRYVKPVVVVAVMCALVLLTGKTVWEFVGIKENDGDVRRI